MNPTFPIRMAGLSAMAAGLLFIVIQIIHPTDVLSSVTTDRWAIVHYLGIAMCLFGIFGVAGIYGRQIKESGWVGLAGFVLFSLFWALSLAFQFIEALISPKLAASSPEYVEGILGIASGEATGMDMGALPEVYAVTGGFYLLGGVALGIATYRAGVLPRLAGASLAVGTVLPVALAFVPHPADRSLAVPVGLSLAWLGYMLWADRGEAATVSVPESGNVQLSQAGAE